MSFSFQSWPHRIDDALKLLSERQLTDSQVETLRSTIRAAGDQIARLDALVYIPGAFECARCKLVVTTPASTTSTKCPNNCGPMWHVTWQKRAQEAEEMLLEIQHRKIRCDLCRGQGEIDDAHGKEMKCYACKGTGYTGAIHG